MASAQSSEHWGSRNAYTVYDHDPGTTDATIVSPDGGTTKRFVDMRDYEQFVVICNVTIGTGGASTVAIVAAEDTAGTNQQTITTVGGALDADALGDFIKAECTAEQIAAVGAAAGYNLRYASAVITCSNSGDEMLVSFIRSGAKRATTGLTPASSIA